MYRFQLKRKGGKEKRRRRRLPAALQGLMGEANLRYARGEFDEAIKMCMEVIRQFSHSPEPYQVTLLCGMQGKHRQPWMRILIHLILNL